MNENTWIRIDVACYVFSSLKKLGRDIVLTEKIIKLHENELQFTEMVAVIKSIYKFFKKKCLTWGFKTDQMQLL